MCIMDYAIQLVGLAFPEDDSHSFNFWVICQQKGDILCAPVPVWLGKLARFIFGCLLLLLLELDFTDLGKCALISLL